MNEQKRNLDTDLAICNAATPGPWVYSEGLYVVKNVTGDSFEWDADFVAEAGAEEDAAFIAAAREGWPHAIRRAQSAEAEVERLRDAAKELLYKYKTSEEQAIGELSFNLRNDFDKLEREVRVYEKRIGVDAHGQDD